MKKYILNLFIFSLTIGIVILILLNNQNNVIKTYEVIRAKLYGNPIDLEGKINNKYFDIDNTGEKETSSAINNAIRYAKQHNVENIQLENGKYKIDGSYQDPYKVGGIKLESNMTLDLNGSTIIQKNCDEVRYSIIGINEVENVTIKNGIIIGDRENHDYTNKNSTHEWGFGIEIKSSENVTIQNVEICNTTGDGIILTSLYGSKYPITKNIDINNARIHNCRRNGISLISAINVNIYENEIYNIEGTAPECAIISESWDESQVIDEINIYRNKIYSNKIGIDIQAMAKNVNIYENETDSSINILTAYEGAKIANNIINDTQLNVIVYENKYKEGKRINKLRIENNDLINSKIYALNVEDMLIINNRIANGNISVYNSSCLIKDNQLTNKKEAMYWGVRYLIDNPLKEKYRLYIGNNKYNEGYKINESIVKNDYCEIFSNNFEQYYNLFEK